MDRKKQLIGIVFVFLSALCFSINSVLIKLIPWSAMGINSIGNLIGGVTIILYMIITKHRFVVNKSVFLGGGFVFLVGVLSTYANKLTTAANVLALQFTMPIFIILAELMFFKMRPKRKDVIASLAVIAGIVFFVVDGLAVGNLLGNFLALLLGATCAGVYMLEELPGNDSFSAIIVGKFLCFLVGIPAAIQDGPLTTTGVMSMLLFGVVQCGLAFIFLPIGLKYASAVSASLLSAAEPILGPVWVAVFYPSEQVTVTAILGFVIIMVSLIIYNVINAKQGQESEALHESK